MGVSSKAMEEARELLGIGDGAERGLSMEEMMEIARAQMGDAEEDEESDAALRAAFEALKETETTQPEAPGGDKLKSSVTACCTPSRIVPLNAALKKGDADASTIRETL